MIIGRLSYLFPRSGLQLCIKQLCDAVGSGLHCMLSHMYAYKEIMWMRGLCITELGVCFCFAVEMVNFL